MLWSPRCNTKMVPVIELSGVQFGLKSYVSFQNRTSKKILKVTYQALALCQNQRMTCLIRQLCKSYGGNLALSNFFDTKFFALINDLHDLFFFTFLVETSHSLCVVQNDCIDVLTKDGALFTITLPFPVSTFFQ